MSNIDQQIKALQLKKKKIDYISYIADLIKQDTKCIDFKDVQKEVIEKIEPFLLQLMESIEKDTAVVNAEVIPFSKEEEQILKTIAARAIQKAPATTPSSGYNQEIPPPVPPKRSESSQLANADKMNFAINNRHLANKRVQVMNDQNAQIFGTVVGLDAPHVLVKTETGPTIQVPIQKIVPV
jgi:hypothetical protein